MAETPQDETPELQPPPDELAITPQRRPTMDARLPQAPDDEWKRLEVAFNGAMILATDPLKIGHNHYADLVNLRYTNTGLEGVQGYAALLTSPLGVPILNGIQYVRLISGNPVSHVLVQAGGTIRLNTTPVPTAGDFQTTPLYTESMGFGQGRFALGPDQSVIYANGVETLIWSSAAQRAMAVVNYDDPTAAFRYDITTRMQNILTDASNTWTLVPETAGDPLWLLIGSSRPLQGITFLVRTPNASPSTSTVEYWDGSAWQPVTGLVDGTASGGITLGQSGTMQFASTVEVARLNFFDERLLYFYRVKIGATGTPSTTIVLTHVTLDVPMQALVDIWDGVERKPILCLQNNQDFTLEILQPSSSVNPIAGDFSGGLACFLLFDEPQTVLRVRMIANSANGNAAVLQVDYFDGTAFVPVPGFRDGTFTGGATLAQSGDLVWSAPGLTTEFKYTVAGRTGYVYRLTTVGLAALSTPTLVDTITGVAAQRFSPQVKQPGYRFPFLFQNRVMLAGRRGSNEGNRIDYSATATPDVFNGEDSSSLGKDIIVGGADDLTAGIEYFDRFSTIANRVIQSLAILHKARETWVLRGSTPDTFQLFPISTTIGNPCPLTLCLAEVSDDSPTSIPKTVALWVSASGPMMFDGGAIHPMRFPQPDGLLSSIEPYFEEADPRFITREALDIASAWYDAQWGEYNVLLPTAGSFVPNAWLCCDLRRRKWYRKVPSLYPLAGIPVVRESGGTDSYGGMATGQLMHLEFGPTWNGTGIQHIVQFGEWLPSGSMWDVTMLRYFKLGVVREAGTSKQVAINHAPDGTGSYSFLASVDLIAGANRWVKVTVPTNFTAWSHQLLLAVTTSDTLDAPKFIGMGILYTVIREEL